MTYFSLDVKQLINGPILLYLTKYIYVIF